MRRPVSTNLLRRSNAANSRPTRSCPFSTSRALQRLPLPLPPPNRPSQVWRSTTPTHGRANPSRRSSTKHVAADEDEAVDVVERVADVAGEVEAAVRAFSFFSLVCGLPLTLLFACAGRGRGK